ncbi:cell wall-binding repeat-containing protein [Desulfosporosinus sp. SYSU MS00001]|uniref:cell wall-binding repeat-containing protein n=1 Tax=Desulfosporosinus sp. SYSU MS00001 TaxID=3416284 RepID=UPI003CECE4BA
MLVLYFTVPAFASTTPITTRLAGIDRYNTAAVIAINGWKQSDYAVIAYGENYPDALSAAPLASKCLIDTTINQDAEYSLPSSVPAKQYNGVPNCIVKVNWHPSSINTSKVGRYTFIGTADGYNGIVTLTVKITGNE